DAKLGKQLAKTQLQFGFSQEANLGKQLAKDPLPFGFNQRKRKKEENFIQKKSFEIAFIHFLKNLI
ncbi:MAG: hypothetical protein WCI53_13135, partial [Bacteroidota bacterium]